MHPAHRRRLEKRHHWEPEARGPLGALRPNVSLSRDPLRPDALPSEPTELDYTPGFQDDGARPRWFHSAAWVLVIIFALRASSFFGGWASSPFVFGSIVLTGVLAAAAYLKVGSRQEALRAVFLATIVAGALATDNPLIPFAALVFALFGVAALAGTGQRHFGAWLAAHMTAPNAFRDVWRALWRRRSLADQLLIGYRTLGRPGGGAPTLRDSKERLAAARETPEVVLHSQALLVLLGALLLGFLVLVLTPIPVFAGLFALGVVTIILAGYATLSLHSYRLAHGMSWSEVHSALRDARATWFSYVGRQAPGVFQSPAGSVQHRLARTGWTYRWLAAATVLLASYFPVGPLVFGPGPWQAANARVVEFRMGEDYPTLERIRASTSEATAAFVAHLDEETRPDYLAASETARLREQRRRANALYGIDVARDVEAWPVLSLLGLTEQPVLHAVALVLALGLCLTAPFALFWTAIVAVAGRAIVHHHKAYDSPDSIYVEPRSPWAAAVERLQGSSNPVERRHVWMGLSREDDYPVLLDRELLQQHMHILGGTGSGKTSRITPLLEQLVRPDCSAVVIDLKGDMALFESARLSAKRAGIPFKWFTSESSRSTFVFNPFTQKHMLSRTALERSQVYSKAFGLEHGPGYGRSHFSSENRDVILRCLEYFDDVPSFAWLDYEIESLKKGAVGKVFSTEKQQQDASDTIAIFRTMARVDALNISRKALPPRIDSREGRTLVDPLDDEERARLCEHAIDMGDVLSVPSVVYFHLPASIHSATNREIGKFALYALLTAADKDADETRVYVFIDEFQEIASDDLDVFLSQARSKGISLILVNQAACQLSKIGAHLLQTVQANTFTNQVLAVNEPEQRRAIMELSGEAMYELYSRSLTQGGSASETRGTREEIGPRFRPNDIIELSARDEECLVTFKENRGYTRFDGYSFRMFSDYHITLEEYRARRGASWPDEWAHEGAFTPPLKRTEPTAPDRPMKPKPKGKSTTGDVGGILDSLET